MHTPAKAMDEVESRFLLNERVWPSLSCFPAKTKHCWLGLLVLDLGLDVVNSVRRFYFEGGCLSGHGLDKDLHTSAKAKDEVKGRLLLGVVI